MHLLLPASCSGHALRWAALFLCLSASVAIAKLPAPTEAAKAAATEAAAKSAWTDKVAAYKLCQVQDRVAARYRQTATAAGKPAPQPLQTPACVDPGPYAAAASEPRPLESSEAHSPPGPAVKPPSSNTHAADLNKESKK